MLAFLDKLIKHQQQQQRTHSTGNCFRTSSKTSHSTDVLQ